MARADSEIVNAALALCGVKRQVGSIGDGTPEANAGAVLYPIARDGLLGEADWPFATRRKTLTARTDGATVPSYVSRTNWSYSYSLPDDFLYAQSITVSGNRSPTIEARIPYAIEAGDQGTGLLLLCDTLDPELVYTCKGADVGSYPPLFTEALIWRLASMMVLPLAVNPQYANMLAQQAQIHLRKAIASSLHQQEEGPVPDSETITVRL